MKKIKINHLNDSLKQKSWEDFLLKNMSNPLLEKAKHLPQYYRDFYGELVGVVSALEKTNPLAQSYYSAEYLDKSFTQRLAPVFSVDNYQLINLHGSKLFDLNEKNSPNYQDTNFSQNNHLFIFSSEESKLYSYSKGYAKSMLFEDMKQHILENPYVLIFKGCDDGHVGMRFKDAKEANNFLNSLNVFEDVFKFNETPLKTLIQIKKENPEQSLHELLKNNLEFHN